MRISVLIPFYNREKYLGEALDSIAKQSHKDWEVLLYNDGSTDGSEKIALEFLKTHPGKLYTSNINRGVGYARNFLLNEINTPYACFMDSDDISDPMRLEKQIEALKYKDIVFTYGHFFNDSGVLGGVCKVDVSKYVNREGLYNNTLFASAMFRTAIAMPFKPLRRKEDIDWLVTLIKYNTRFGVVPEPLYLIRRHEERLTKKI